MRSLSVILLISAALCLLLWPDTGAAAPLPVDRVPKPVTKERTKVGTSVPAGQTNSRKPEPQPRTKLRTTGQGERKPRPKPIGRNQGAGGSGTSLQPGAQRPVPKQLESPPGELGPPPGGLKLDAPGGSITPPQSRAKRPVPRKPESPPGELGPPPGLPPRPNTPKPSAPKSDAQIPGAAGGSVTSPQPAPGGSASDASRKEQQPAITKEGQSNEKPGKSQASGFGPLPPTPKDLERIANSGLSIKPVGEERQAKDKPSSPGLGKAIKDGIQKVKKTVANAPSRLADKAFGNEG